MKKGIPAVVITLGSKGALIATKESYELVGALPVDAVDTTAAGDVFNGALAVALAEGKSLFEAVKFGCTAATISVTISGAQPSIPLRNEIEKFAIK